ncbi:MAG: tetratricopeptide repeat protein [Acidobacteriota bacterium]|nr:tetratricopeptide repeat protein [Acidobacteriota bacterium]
MKGSHRIKGRTVGAISAGLLIASAAAVLAQIAMPDEQKMRDRVNPAIVRQLNDVNATLARNPRNVEALKTRGYLELSAAHKNPYSFFWLYKAAKDLEYVIQKMPDDYAARHNYAQVCFQTGDMGSDQPNMRLAVSQFTKAIELNPRGARSYMGRGWAYQMLNDRARANADYEKALVLDPSLRADLYSEANGIDLKRGQLAAAGQDLERMGRYYVDQSVHNENDCRNKAIGLWINGECRISAALNPSAR